MTGIKWRLVPALLLLVPLGVLAAEHFAGESPGFISVVPSLVAIAAALYFKQVIPALFLGVWFGAWAASGFGLTNLGISIFAVVETYMVDALADRDHVAIIVFTMLIGAMVGIISCNGGMKGVLDRIVVWANTPRRAQLGTGLMGVMIFFDDYANTLVVGNTMRPITDHMKVSREKLAYLVDSTAAPMACLALVTTWIGYEVGLIDKAIENIPGLNDPFIIFLNSLVYSFYPILALIFVFMIAGTGLDFGPMWQAEKRSREHGSSKGHPLIAAAQGIQTTGADRYYPADAIIPILVLLGSVMAGLAITGEGEGLREIVGSADPFKSLLWGSFAGLLSAALITIMRGSLTMTETVDAAVDGSRSVLAALVILVLAWSLAATSNALGTADYLVSVLGDFKLPQTLPAMIFILAGITAFATGTSWGAMGILMPLAVPLAWSFASIDGQVNPETMHIMYSSVACVLAGAVWGDHCSPISDTTVLSSMASGCDHVEHVNTQLPYALTAGATALLVGTLPAGFGLPWWLGLSLGVIILWFVLKLKGRGQDA